MKIVLGFFIFCLVLFLYLHIQFHLKKSDELEIYELDDDVSKEKFEEVCDLRQPVVFNNPNGTLMELTQLRFIQNEYPAFEVKVRNVKESANEGEKYMPVPLHDAIQLFQKDKDAQFYTENNQDFLEETAAIKNFQYNDEFLRPAMMSNNQYDFITGSKGVITPFRYELNYRTFFLVTSGSVQVKLAPPKSIKYLYPESDYEAFEFSSPVNPWSIQPKFKADFGKIKCLECTLTPGKVFFLPAFWWYSFRIEEPNTAVSCFRYRTYMNNVAISPQMVLYGLQLQNIKRKNMRSLDNSTNPKEKGRDKGESYYEDAPEGEPVDLTNENLESGEPHNTDFLEVNDVNDLPAHEDILDGALMTE